MSREVALGWPDCRAMRTRLGDAHSQPVLPGRDLTLKRYCFLFLFSHVCSLKFLDTVIEYAIVTGKCLGHVPSPQKVARGHRRYPTRAGALDVGRAGDAALSDRRTSSSPFLQLPIGWLLEIRERHPLSML